MPEIRDCPICGEAYRRRDWEICKNRKLTCGSKVCQSKWKSNIAPNKKPIGPCAVSGCSFVGPLDLRKYCRTHYAYHHRHGVTTPPPLNVQPLNMPLKYKTWLAAVIDCDGWISMSSARDAKSSAGTIIYGPMIGVANTKERLIDTLLQRAGVGGKRLEKRPAPSKHIFTWAVTKRINVARVLLTVLPHLVLKRRQARLLLMLPPPNARDSERRARIKRLLKKLNRKGC